MKRIFNWMLAAILTCGATAVATSCSDDDDKPDKKCSRIEVKFNFATLPRTPTTSTQGMHGRATVR